MEKPSLSRARKIRGFTLVELIVVITILAVLATVGFLALSGYSQDAKDSAIKANVRSVQAAIATEGALSNNSPRYYVVHDADYALSGAFAYVDGASVALTGGDVGAPPADSNYTAGKPNWARLKLNPDKFRISSSGLPGGTLGVVARASGFGSDGAEASYDASSVMAAGADFVSVGPSGRKRVVSYSQAAAVSPSTRLASVAGSFPTSGVPAGNVSGLLRAEPGSATNLTGSLVDGSAANPSSSAAGTYANCQAIKAAVPSSTSGTYSIDPDGAGSNPSFQAYCDMTTLWGGWTLVMNLDTSDGNVMHYENPLWTNASSYGTVPSSLSNINDYKNGSAFTSLTGSQLLVSVHTEWTPYASTSYNLNETAKTLSYYFNKGSNVQLTSSLVLASVTTALNASEPIVAPNSNLYLNTARGMSSTDLDRISIWWTITDNYGGGLGTWYDSSIDRQRPRVDAQLLNCRWEATLGCRIGTDYDSANANSSWNGASALAYDYAFFVR